MDHFYFIRHGQTDANLQGLMCGASWDICLNTTGIQQAETAALLLRNYIDSVGAICASPMIRAQKTAEIIANQFQVPITPIEELREWDIGSWDRVPFEHVKDAFLGTGEPRGGETRAQFRSRVNVALEKCRKHAKPLLIVSHGAVWLAIQEILGVLPTKVENGIPYKVLRKKDAWEAIKL